MRGFSIQFHAFPEELSDIFGDIIAEQSLHLTGTAFPPFHIVVQTRGSLSSVIAHEDVERVVVTETPVDSSATSMNKLLEQYPGALLLNVGRLTERGLSESRISTVDTTGRWKGFADRLRKRTRAGATATTPGTTFVSRNRAHRYTQLAQESNAKGVIMIPVAGMAILKFD